MFDCDCVFLYYHDILFSELLFLYNIITRFYFFSFYFSIFYLDFFILKSRKYIIFIIILCSIMRDSPLSLFFFFHKFSILIFHNLLCLINICFLFTNDAILLGLRVINQLLLKKKTLKKYKLISKSFFPLHRLQLYLY